MKYKILSVLMSISLLAGMTAVIPHVGAAEAQSVQTGASGTTGSCTWSLSGTVLTISGNGRMKDYDASYNSSTKPPWGKNITKVIVNYGVTYIGEDAFYGCESLTEVHLSDGTLKEIGVTAFGECRNLGELVIPDSVETIDEYAFGSCYSLTDVTLSNNLTSLGYNAFYRCLALEQIELPDSLTELEGEVFYMCTKLKSVKLPSQLESIGVGAFQYCSALESVTLPTSLEKIGEYAFSASGLRSVTIPSFKKLSTLPQYMFYQCFSLSEVTLPRTIAGIDGKDNNAFDECSADLTIKAPKGSFGESLAKEKNYKFKEI